MKIFNQMNPIMQRNGSLMQSNKPCDNGT